MYTELAKIRQVSRKLDELREGFRAVGLGYMQDQMAHCMSDLQMAHDSLFEQLTGKDITTPEGD